jgi:hypothetical protein
MKFVDFHTKVLKSWSAIFHRFFGQCFEQDHHSLQMAGWQLSSPLRIFICHWSLSIQHHCLTFLSLITFWPWWISTTLVVLAWRKWIIAWILHLVGLLISGHITTHSVETRRKLGDQLCDGLQGNEPCNATFHVQALPYFYISYQK